MKYLSVCSGIEAATVAWHGFGWTPVAFAEVEAFPSAVLAHHYPTVPNLGDLTRYREWPEELLADVDLLVGGTPCQAFSVAGLRRSLDDERGNLSLTYVNLFHHINEVRKRHGRSPAIALWENVPGVLSTKDNAFGCFIGGLLRCDEAPQTESGKWDKAGFLSSETVRVGYRVLDAQYFGVAQRRRRVFLVAVPSELVQRFGERVCPSAILSLRESVLGNPPTRGKAWEGVARATASGLTSSGRGVERCGESRVQDDVVISVPDVANSLTHRMHTGMNTTVDEGQTPIVTAFVGNKTSGPLDVATSCLAHSGSHGRQDFASETFVCESADVGAPQCFYSNESRCDNIPPPDISPPVKVGSGSGGNPPAVAFKPSHFTRGKDGKPDTVAPPLSADADKGDQDTVIACNNTGNGWWNGPEQVAATVRAECDRASVMATAVLQKAVAVDGGNQSTSEDIHHTLRIGRDSGDAVMVPAAYPIISDADQSDSSAQATKPHAVAFAQNSRDEVRRVGDVHATIDANKGSRRQEGVVAFAQNQAGELRTNPDVMGTVNTNQNASGRNTPMVASAMQVRRLTPTECCRLQGFPDDYCDITFRKKPAADGPKYRALGNSMAVPCMWWLGLRIHKATSHD